MMIESPQVGDSNALRDTTRAVYDSVMHPEPPDHAAPTELAGAAQADTLSSYAWSEFDGEAEDYPESLRWPVWVTAGAVAVSVGLAVTAGVLAFQYMGHESQPVAGTQSQTVAAPVPVAPPPPTVTTVIVHEPPPAEAPPQQQQPGILPPAVLASLDQKFLANAKAAGATIKDQDQLFHDAHLTCAYLQQGKSVAEVNRMYAEASGLGLSDAQIFSSLVMSTYPNCP